MKILLTFILLSSFLFAKLNLTKEEKEFIKNNPIIKIGLTNDKPFTFKEDNEIKGLTKDILEEISIQTNLKFDIVQKQWKENFKDFKEQKISIISDFFYKKERENFSLYSTSYIKLPLVIFSNKPYSNFKSFKDFKHIKVGVIKESQVIQSLKNYENIDIVVFDDQNDQISALSFGKIDFALQTLHTANVYIRKNFFTNIYPIKNYDNSKYYEGLYFGINKQKPILQSIINKSLNNINLNSIKEKWFNLKTYKPKITLNNQEKEFLKKHPIIKLGTEKSWEPYVIKEKNGNVSGYDIDILNKINELTGANFQLELGNWLEMQKKAKERKIDGLSTGAIHNERKEYLNFSDTYISLQKMVIVKHRNPLKIQSIKDLEGKTIVIHKGNLVDEKIARSFQKSKIIKVDTVEQMLKEVIYGKADATFGNGATEYITSKLGLPYLDFAFPLNHRLELSFGIRKDWPEAISIINKALNHIPEYEKLRLKEKWFVLSEYEKKYKYKKNNLLLSVDEKLYLKDNPSINFCINTDWYPFEYINKRNQHDGLISELFDKLTSNIDIKTKLIKTKSWQESLEFIKDKKCDLLTAAQRTPHRENFLNFTTPYINSPIVIATKSNVNFIDDFLKVSNKSFSIVKGNALSELLKKKYPNINIVEVANINIGLKKVIKSEVFGFIDTVPTILDSIKENGYLGIHINGKLDLNLELSIATRKDIPIINSIFQKAIEDLNEKDKKFIYDKWINISNIKEADYTIYWQILTGLILLIFIILIWNRQLNKKTNEAIKKYKEQESLIFYYSKQKSMGELIGNISHQWRHPLSELSGNLMHLEIKQKLGKDISSNEINEHIQNSKKIITFMSDTIETFYNFYKDRQEKTKFNISDAIDETLLILNTSFSIENICVTKEMKEKIYINGNPNEFKQVLLSILVNSKSIFKLRKIENPRIIIQVKKINKNKCIIIITDNGGGIEEKLIPHIFDLKFSTKNGNGVGLYLSKKIIEEKFNGKIDYKNSIDGAKFIIHLYLIP